MRRQLFAAIFFIILLSACTSAQDGSNEAHEQPKSEVELAYKEKVEKPKSEVTPVTFKDLVPLNSYKVNALPAGNKASYEIDLEMNVKGEFTANASISIENDSDESWQNIQFYFIPNAFTAENKPDFLESAANVELDSVLVNDKQAPHSLDYDTLDVQLETPLDSGEKVKVDVAYSFTLPNYGIRLAKIEYNYYLAQWYPMLATYRNGWNKEDYNPLGESYHTSFSDFTIHYELPQGYTVYSTDDQETEDETVSGTLKMNNVKEFYLAITKTAGMHVEKTIVNDTEIRVIGHSYNKNDFSSVLPVAIDGFQFFEKHIGDYPHKQLDIIMDEGGMEYPGIVTVGQMFEERTDEQMEQTVIHEIAHQWFYGMVSNDPYYDPWVDEGIAQYATTLYLMESEDLNLEEILGYPYKVYTLAESTGTLKFANLPLDQYEKTYSENVYTQPPVQLHELFADYGGNEKALGFLQSYYEHYRYKEVDTQEFLNLLRTYLQLEDVSVFDEWIRME